jgi:hypothetical protein
MFSSGFEHPQWDVDRKYTPDKLLVCMCFDSSYNVLKD